jgi:urea transporter
MPAGNFRGFSRFVRFPSKKVSHLSVVTASICAGIACAFVAGELVGGLNVVLGYIARDSVAAACSNAGLSLVIKVLASGEKAYDGKKS